MKEEYNMMVKENIIEQIKREVKAFSFSLRRSRLQFKSNEEFIENIKQKLEQICMSSFQFNRDCDNICDFDFSIILNKEENNTYKWYDKIIRYILGKKTYTFQIDFDVCIPDGFYSCSRIRSGDCSGYCLHNRHHVSIWYKLDPEFNLIPTCSYNFQIGD